MKEHSPTTLVSSLPAAAPRTVLTVTASFVFSYTALPLHSSSDSEYDFHPDLVAVVSVVDPLTDPPATAVAATTVVAVAVVAVPANLLASVTEVELACPPAVVAEIVVWYPLVEEEVVVLVVVVEVTLVLEAEFSY